MAAFEGCFRVLAARPAAGGIALCPLRCACLTADEEVVLGLVAAAQRGQPEPGGRDAGRGRGPPRAARARRDAGRFLVARRASLCGLARAA